ncbi:MAG: YciI family protein [Geodermatophilaceae bacterium]|nr:YciI family protein [Geodermatophilaceae bacterium]
MRYMVIVKSNPTTEAGKMPATEVLEAMGRFNEEMARAGILLAGEGLHPSTEGARVRINPDSSTTVTDGPFTETKELVAGFWILQVRSRDEAVEWASRMPTGGHETELEIRRVFDAEDFGDAFSPEQREREQRLRNEIGQS